jgi:SAM-dependent methyltransferase
MGALPAIVEMTRTERARIDFVAGMMRYNSVSVGPAMAAHYVAHAPRDAEAPPRIEDIAAFMEPSVPYRLGAFLERYNHASMFRASLDVLQARRAEVRRWLDRANEPGAIGSLELDASVKPPSYYRKLEIHTQPGNYHGEFAGILYHWMIGPFFVNRDDQDGMGWALARGVPERGYRQILDLGCGVGKSTLPYCDQFPSAEVWGLDYAEEMLKYAHRLAEDRGKKVRYVQALAERTGLKSESFDLVTAIFLFHEMPRKARDETVREAWRLLRPGGVFAIMESPPFKVLQEHYSPLSAFLLDSTGRRMDDPYIPQFFEEDRVEMFKRGGFDNVRDVALTNELTGWGTGASYFFGAYPWWMTIGEKP